MKAFQTSNMYTLEGQRIGWMVDSVDQVEGGEIKHIYFFDVDRCICGILDIFWDRKRPIDREDIYDAYAAGGYDDASSHHKNIVALKFFVECEAEAGRLDLFVKSTWS